MGHQGEMPETNMVRIRKGEYHDVIANYEEVEQALLESRFAHLVR